MSNKFTINDISFIFSIPKQTLRYYDHINLFVPAMRDPNTGYRYYVYEQFRTLLLIKSLRRIGVPVKTIDEYLQKKDIQRLRGILKDQIAEIDSQIAAALRMKELAMELQAVMQQKEQDRELLACELKKIPRRYALSLDMNFKTEKLYDCIEVLYQSYNISNKLDAHDLDRVVLMIDQKNLASKAVDTYNSIGFLLDYLEEPLPSAKCKYIEGGDYACLLHFGSYKNIGNSYLKLLDFVAGEACEIVGASTEISHISMSYTENANHFITEIQIPVAKKE